MTQFDFSFVDWSDDDSSPFDQCDLSESSSSSTDSSPFECCSSSSTRTRKIRFAQEDDVVDHIHIKDYTPEDIEATWFRPQEFRAMRERAQQFVNMMEHRTQQGEQPTVETDTMTSRGLEFRTTEGGMKRSLHKRQAYAAVLEEQERQWIYGKDAPDRIAAAYQIVSSKCLGLAMLRGVQDEQDIRDYVAQSSSSPSTTDEFSSSTSSSCTTIVSSAAYESSSTTSPCKPYEMEISIRRLAVLEDIKILSGAVVVSELGLWHTNPAAA